MTWFSHRSHEAGPPALVIDPGACGSEEEVAAAVAEQAAGLVPNQGVYLYWLDHAGRRLHLRATHTPQPPVTVRPDYAGLVAGSGHTPVPLTIDLTGTEEALRLTGAVDEPWIQVCVGRYMALHYRLAPRQKVDSAHQALLREWAASSLPMVTLAHALVSSHHERRRLQGQVRSSATAVEAFTRPDVALDLLLGLAVPLFAADDAALVVASSAASGRRCLAARGRGHQWWQFLPGSGPDAGGTWPEALTEGPWQAPDGRTVYLVSVPVQLQGATVGAIYLLSSASVRWDAYRKAMLLMISDRAGQSLGQQELAREATHGYLATLHALVLAMDSLAPHSRGHSDRIARYSRMLALASGLSPEEVEAVALAGYLHDVGMVTVPPELVLKPSRLSAAEYEEIKNHPEVGADLVAMVQAALPIAPMIGAHHERWDGLGYPRSLRGEGIPLGARIVALADAFDAKTTGRSYRPPVPFDQALAELQAAAGTQLDPDLVRLFVQIIMQDRLKARSGLPLHPCWEAKQLTAAVCGDCPNRVTRAVPCWQEEGRQCDRHGDTCATCPVFTETLSRPGPQSTARSGAMQTR